MSSTQPPNANPIRRLSAVWFADIVGFTSITSVNETLGLRHVELLQRIARRETEESYKGRIVKFIGDAALAEFGSADAAVRAALAVSALYTQEAHELGRNSTLRIGVHLGEVILADDGDIYGDGVNVASRLQSEAEPGRVLITEDVWRQLRQRPEFMFHALGQREMKGITAPIGVYDVLVRGTEYGADALHPRAELERTRFTRPSRLIGAGAALGVGAALLTMLLLRPEATHDDTIALSDWSSAGGADSVRVERFKSGLMDELQVAIREAGLNNSTSERPSRFVLQGRVRAANDSTRIVVELKDTKHANETLWTNTYQTTLTDRFDVHRALAQEINTTVAGELRREGLIKPLPVVEVKAPAPLVEPKKQPAVSPREAAIVSSRRAVTNFARTVANRSAKDQYPFGAAVMKEIRSFDVSEASITDVTVERFKVVDYQQDRLEADLMLIIKQRSGSGFESLPLPFRATLTRTADTWHLTGFRPRR